MLTLGKYLEASPELTTNLALETSECILRTEGSLYSSCLIEIKSHSHRIIPEAARNL